MFTASRVRCRPVGIRVAGVLALNCLVGWSATEVANAAGMILDSGGFENPYAIGLLQGQFGWLTAGSGTSTATVQNSIAQSGSQAVQVVRTANSDRRWAVPVSGFPTQRFVAIDWDMRVSPPSNLTAFGPFFGVDTYDADTGIYVLGSLGVDATTGDVLYQIQGTGDLTETGTFVTLNQWHHYRIVLDFGMDTYRGYVNGALVATTGFVDGNFGLNDFTDADIAAFAAGEDPTSQGLSSTAVFDNFLVRDGLLGDYDIDGDVDNADYSRWRATFGTSIAPAGNNADGNGNGVVDAADYAVWRDNFGASLFSGSGLGSVALVPEPASVLLSLAGALSTLCITACPNKRRRLSR